MVKMNESPAFDYAKYGALLRLERTRLGYRKADVFIRHFIKTTGMHMSKDILHKIETGATRVRLDMYCALNLALDRPAFDDWIAKQCVPDEWTRLEDLFD